MDTRTGVNDEDYQVPFPFSGTIDKLAFKLGPTQLAEEDHCKIQLALATANDRTKEHIMTRSITIVTVASTVIVAAAAMAQAQGMLLDYAADRVIKKYQTSTCEQLKASRDQAPSEKEKMAMEFLRNDQQARIAFIDKIAAPVANKMFECGMFP